MYRPRATQPLSTWRDPDRLKIYAITADGEEVDPGVFAPRLAVVKASRAVDWAETPGFAIFHRGATQPYLVLAWWENGNELFTSVSALESAGWVEDPSRFSFCIWDLEVVWHERRSFIQHLYSGRRDLEAYRRDVMPPIPAG